MPIYYQTQYPKPKSPAGRKRASEDVRVVGVMGGSTDDADFLRISMAWDVTERLLKLREPNAKLTPYYERGLRLIATSFEDRSTPAVFLQIAPFVLNTFETVRLPRLSRANKGRRFIATIKAKTLGIRGNLPSKLVDLLWLEDPRFPRGLILCFENEDMLYSGPKTPIRTVLEREGVEIKP